MKKSAPDDLSNLSMLELFRVETENQTAILTSGLLELESKVPGARGEVRGARGQGSGEPDTSHLAPITSHLTPGPSHLAPLLESLMRAAHSLKGAARIVNLPSAAHVAHAMEDCFVAAQQGRLELRQAQIDVLLRGVDLLANLAKSSPQVTGGGARAEGRGAKFQVSGEPDSSHLTPDTPPVVPDASPVAPLAGEAEQAARIEDFLRAVAGLMPQPGAGGESKVPGVRGQVSGATRQGSGEPDPSHLNPRTVGTHPAPDASAVVAVAADATLPSTPARQFEAADRVLRLTAENLNRLLGLAGESLVESRWLRPFTESMQRLKRMQVDLERTLAGLREELTRDQCQGSGAKCQVHLTPDPSHLTPQPSHLPPPSALLERVNEVLRQAAQTRQVLGERLQELEGFDRRSAQLSNRLYLEVLRTRMRPFGDGTRRFPRMVRDLARALGKEVRLEITGENTPVDRDLLDRLETPLAHLLRNAVDHGCEPPDVRVRAGKPPVATIRLEARHSAGMLQVVVSDDGAGLDLEVLRRKVAEFLGKKNVPGGKGQVSGEPGTWHLTPDTFSEAELLPFLYLPGFTLKETATEISGRGVGLDIVQHLVKSVRGSVRVFNNAKGSMPKAECEKNVPGAREVRGARGQVSGAPDTSHLTRDTFSGLTFQLQLPLTLSVLRVLLVEVGGSPRGIGLSAAECDRRSLRRGEPYAFPLVQIGQTLRLPREQIEVLEGRPHFKLGGQPVGLVAADRVFGVGEEVRGARGQVSRGAPERASAAAAGQSDTSHLTPGTSPVPSSILHPPSSSPPSLPVVVLGERGARYGLWVDRFLGERELVVHTLDARLGKIPDISAAALMEDGSPVLIVDVDELLQSIEQGIKAEGSMLNSAFSLQPLTLGKPKRVLAVDDSLTVRELERKLLEGRGYQVDVAVDGVEGWHRLVSGAGGQVSGGPDTSHLTPRTSPYDLVITDVDMPRLDGIELAKRIRRDPHLKSLPVMVVSYKDRAADRLRGLEAGADYYLTKSSFQDETFLQAVLDLIGPPESD